MVPDAVVLSTRSEVLECITSKVEASATTCVLVIFTMIRFLLIQIVLALLFDAFASSDGSTDGMMYTEEEKQELLDAHNYYRANVEPPASNMIEMEWDEGLAVQAQHWAELCVFAHPKKKEHPDYQGVGQNLFFRRPNRPPTTGPVKAWYNEVRFYNISSSASRCLPGKVCGHYTQVVWAKSTKVGCGISFCPELTKGPGKEDQTTNNAWHVACNYSPAGNYKGVIPYKPGNPCSECTDGKLCKNNLCTDCSAGEEGCECKLECKNCGSTDIQTCQCSCPDGYFGELCETYCEDTSSKCGRGFPTKWCNKKAFVDSKCPLMCGICTPGSRVDSTSC